MKFVSQEAGAFDVTEGSVDTFLPHGWLAGLGQAGLLDRLWSTTEARCEQVRFAKG